MAEDEVIGRLSFDSQRLQHVGGEVLQVRSDDDLCGATNRSGYNMAVVRVWQRDAINQVFIAGHKAVPDGRVHQSPGPYERFILQLRPRFLEAGEALVEDPVGPFGLHQAR